MEDNKVTTTGTNELNLFLNSKAIPKQYWITTQPKTAVQAFKSTSAQIIQIKKQPDGEIISKAFLSFIVTELVSSFNVGKTMNDMQIAFAVNGIEADYYFLNIDELKFCFGEAKKGRYGTMYDRIDAAVIFEWIEKYIEERIQLCFDEQINQNKAYKKEPIPDMILDVLKNVSKTTEPVSMDLIVPEKRQRTEHEQLIQDIFIEFDKLHRDKPYDSDETVRTIKHNNQNLTQTEFLEIRLEELKKL